MSHDSMPHVNFKKWLCRLVDLNIKGHFCARLQTTFMSSFGIDQMMTRQGWHFGDVLVQYTDIEEFMDQVYGALDT